MFLWAIHKNNSYYSMIFLAKLMQGQVFLNQLLLVSIYSIANYFIIKLLVSPGHLKIERKLAQHEMERFTEALIREGGALETR
jgi:hypothetical protein